MILSGAVLSALSLETGVRKEGQVTKKPRVSRHSGVVRYRVKKEKNGREA
ncbi:FAD-binding protein [Bacillus velezensis]|nr:FAD-binding protein [Bacillus velezensis]